MSHTYMNHFSHLPFCGNNTVSTRKGQQLLPEKIMRENRDIWYTNWLTVVGHQQSVNSNQRSLLQGNRIVLRCYRASREV